MPDCASASSDPHYRLETGLVITHNELLWIEVIRQASGDTDPPLSFDAVRRVRAIFRGLPPSATADTA